VDPSDRQQRPVAVAVAAAVPQQQQVVITEAQLRWAQFHRKNRASQVSQAVLRMWTSPLEEADVPGASLPHDGDTGSSSYCSDSSGSGSGRSTGCKDAAAGGGGGEGGGDDSVDNIDDSDNDNNPNIDRTPDERTKTGADDAVRSGGGYNNNNNIGVSASGNQNGTRKKGTNDKKKRKKKANRPSISRGRRALLRVSKRALERRRELIRSSGYAYRVGGGSSFDDDEDEEEGNDGERLGTRRRNGNRRNDSGEIGDPDDALAAIFAEGTAAVRKKHRRRHRRRAAAGGTMGTAEQQRIERFEAAFHSMMMRLANASSASAEDAVPAPAKIWTRPEGLSEAGVDFADLKWGSSRKEASSRSATLRNPAMMLMDRGASWLVHLPAKVGTSSSRSRQQQQLQQYLHHHGYVDDRAFAGGAWDGELEGGERDENAGRSPGPPSPMRRTFSDIVDRLQQQIRLMEEGEDGTDDEEHPDETSHSISGSHVASNLLSKYFEPAQLSEDREEKKEEHPSNYGGNVVAPEKEAGESDEAPWDEEGGGGGGTPVATSASLELDAALGTPGRETDSTPRRRSNGDALRQSLMSPEDPIRAAVGLNPPKQRGEGNRELDSAELVETATPRGSSSALPMASSGTSGTLSIHERLSSLRKPERKTSLLVNSMVEQIDSSLVRDLEENAPGISRELFTLYLEDSGFNPDENDGVEQTRRRLLDAAQEQIERYARRYMYEEHQIAASSTPRTGGEDSLVKRFVAKIMEQEKANSMEPLIMADGKLHKATFANLVRRYLVESSPEKQHRLGGQRRFSGSSSLNTPVNKGVVDRYLDGVNMNTGTGASGRDLSLLPGGEAVSAIVESFLAKVNQASEEELAVVVGDDGKLDGQAFEQMMARYLAETTGATEEEVSAVVDLQSLKVRSPHRSHSLVEHQRDNDVNSANTGASAASPAVKPDFVKNFVAQIERAAQVQEMFTSDGKLDKLSFENLLVRYVEQDAPKTERAFLSDVKSPLVLARARQSARNPSRVLRTSLDHSGPRIFESPVAVKRFLSCIEKESEKESNMKPDGKLDANAFERLVDRCLSETIASSEAYQHLPGVREEPSSSFTDVFFLDRYVHNFVENCANHSREDLFVDGGRIVDKILLTDVVVSCLENASTAERKYQNPLPMPKAFVDRFVSLVEEESMLGSFRGAVLGEDHVLLEDLTRHWAEEAVRETSEDPAALKLASSHESSSLRTDHTYQGSTASSSPGTHSSTKWQNPKQNDAVPDDMDHAALAETMSGKVGGFMKMLYRANESDGGELEAVAAFRRTQDTRRSADDASSMSSFRVLPDGIKKVVQNFRRGQLPLNEEEEEGSVAGLSSVRPDGSSVVGSLDGLSSFSMSQSNFESDLSPTRLKNFHHHVLENSVLLGEADPSIIDTDGSDVSHEGMDSTAVSNLLMSPTILTKRHQQAIRAVENRNWDQVEYLLSANPWLAEMTDLKTQQYLLHKVALYGSGDGDQKAIPDHVNTDLVRMFPASVHKFDCDGNLPLHMAAASANVEMIGLLGDRFPSGASVRNEDGMLVS